MKRSLLEFNVKPEEFTSSTAGVCRRTVEGYHAFFPNKLPPALPLDWDAQKGVSFWQRQGLLHEYTGRKRNRVFVAQELLDLMSTAPPHLQAGQPLTSYSTIVELIGSTTTQTGLHFRSQLVTKEYPTNRKVSDQEMKTINIDKHMILPNWNYTIFLRKIGINF